MGEIKVKNKIAVICIYALAIIAFVVLFINNLYKGIVLMVIFTIAFTIGLFSKKSDKRYDVLSLVCASSSTVAGILLICSIATKNSEAEALNYVALSFILLSAFLNWYNTFKNRK